ncbi:50S ribosomal protein L11 methyltransferase [Lentisphaerota bacterium WC36G]|nr:50S ribosomal protein L11 methyltransferase [Lentisphaerae bacterium WC36]
MDDLLYCCKLIDTSENSELAVELLMALELDFSSWEDREGGVNYHTIFATTEEEIQQKKQFIEELLPIWHELGVNISDLETFSIKKEDWTEVWKKYFNVIEVTKRLVIKPQWLDYKQKEGQIIVEIDPGMSFGTGQHATTNFCLKMIDKLAKDAKVKTFLDAGSGSGILSIAAMKLEYSDIHAFDIEEDSVRIAKENIEKNGLNANNVNMICSDLANYSLKNTNQEDGFDLVAANILGHVLVANREKIMSFVKKGGYLILAGILETQFEEFTGQFVKLGLEKICDFTEKEWKSGLYKKI